MPRRLLMGIDIWSAYHALRTITNGHGDVQVREGAGPKAAPDPPFCSSLLSGDSSVKWKKGRVPRYRHRPMRR